ncbi:MAG: glycoside hydrolase family 37 [Pseudobdellovibrio sp.]|jgi:neutral trehalase|nr:glycoside hydrolase family 37 [Pseudobdellovibrio sp.]
MKKWLTVFISFLTLTATFNATAEEPRPAHWEGGFKAAYERLEQNLKRPGKRNPYWHVNPAPKYPGVYLWDSAFISLIWKNKNSAIAQDVIRSVLHNQKKDGRIPHVVSILGASKWTQPPVLTWAAYDILTLTQDVKFANDAYPKLKFFHEWLWKNRRLENGLFFWKHAYESGIDNSPRFGVRDESHYEDTTKIAAVDITSYLIMDSKALAHMAKFLIDNDPQADKEKLQRDIELFIKNSDETSAALNQHLWDEETGYYYDLSLKTGKLIKIATVASFFPLTAKAAPYDRFLKLREHAVNNKEFNTVFPFPTVSHSDPTFEKDMWRGPVWINTSFMAIRGFKNYGDQELVKYHSRNLVDSVYQVWARTGTFFEFYDPDRYDLVEVTRKKGLGPLGLSASKNPIEVLKHLVLKQIILGKKPVNKFMGWTGLVNTLAIEELGYDPTKKMP